MLSKIEVRFQSAEGRRRRQAAFARTAPIRRVLFDATTLYGDGIRYHSVHVFCILIKKSIFFFGSRLFRTFFTHSGMIFATLFVVCYFFFCLPQVFSPSTGIMDFAVSMRPDYHQAIIDTIRHYGWHNIIYLYNSHDGKSII